MVSFIATAVIAWIISSCSTTYTVGMHTSSEETSPDLSYEQVNAMLDTTQWYTVTQLDGSSQDVHRALIKGDFMIYINETSSDTDTVRLRDVRDIRDGSRWTGPLVGFCVGAGLGGLGGALMSYELSGLKSSSNNCDNCVAGALVFGVPGALLGSIIGAIIGRTAVFQFLH